MVTGGGRWEKTVSSALAPPGDRSRDDTAERTSPGKLAGDSVRRATSARRSRGCEAEDVEEEESMPCHGGVPARVLERRLHELLQSRHEERIAEIGRAHV